MKEIMLGKDATTVSLRAVSAARATVPQVFIGGRHIGGSDDLETFLSAISNNKANVNFGGLRPALLLSGADMKLLNVDVAVIGGGTAGARRLSRGKLSTPAWVMIEGGPYGTTYARVGVCHPSC